MTELKASGFLAALTGENDTNAGWLGGVREPQELRPEVSMALAAPPQGPVSAL